jgi:hypothetical protein
MRSEFLTFGSILRPGTSFACMSRSENPSPWPRRCRERKRGRSLAPRRHDSPPRRVVRVVRPLPTSAATAANTDASSISKVVEANLRVQRNATSGPVPWAGLRTMVRFENANRPTGIPASFAFAGVIGPIGPLPRREGDEAMGEKYNQGGGARSSPVRSAWHRKASRGICATSVQPRMVIGRKY